MPHWEPLHGNKAAVGHFSKKLGQVAAQNGWTCTQEKQSAACHFTYEGAWSIICAGAKIKTAKIITKGVLAFSRKFAPAKNFPLYGNVFF